MLIPNFRDLISEFNAEGVEFMIVGAYALAVHGIPRATGDIDLWINTNENNVARVVRALERYGAPAGLFDRKDLETPDRVIQIGVDPERVDILTSIEGVSFADAYRDRIEVIVDDVVLPYISLRYFITNKRACDRPKDRLDLKELEKFQRSGRLRER